MKKSLLLMFASVVMMTSCGTMSQLASSGSSQKFQDGIYSKAPDFRSKTEKAESKAETDALIAKTKESPIYLFGDKKDTVMIPENFSATIKYDQKLGNTVVTVSENPYDWRNNINPWSYYSPYGPGASWHWVRYYDPWRWHSWHYSGYWGRWYDPWYWDPWYWGGWYDPWYYGYAGYWGGYWGWPYHHHQSRKLADFTRG